MITFAINLATNLLSGVKPMKLSVGNSDALKCRIVEITEQQNYQLPQFPIDKAEYRSDTIYKQPLNITMKVFVEANNIDAFLKAINQAQFSQNLFIISSMYNHTYNTTNNINQNITSATPKQLADGTNKILIDSINHQRQQQGAF